MITFYATIGFTWAFFCMYQGVIQSSCEFSKTILLMTILGFIVNYLIWPISMGIAIRGLFTGKVKVRCFPKSKKERDFDCWFEKNKSKR